ncbi:transforming acidic coiled-coil-containing protein 3-like isoform X2 [Anneissia japonica]|uniref:transforming acidic coiled-coil-containing protein 3-like isoform X2 n=1 Tax=Anneissia japonica TaxID=1529436 RepID=UPI001425AC8C|nr:transforming acidic coiled-coil-containing protein 3-like isoform X2 [Anneissia japonica]
MNSNPFSPLHSLDSISKTQVDIDILQTPLLPVQEDIDSLPSPLVPSQSGILKPSQKENILVSPLLSVNNKKVTFQTPLKPNKGKSLPSNPAYEFVRELDDKESWIERVQVVTKQDHTDYINCANEFVNELIDNLPIREEEDSLEQNQKQPVDLLIGIEDKENQHTAYVLGTPCQKADDKMAGKSIADMTDEELANYNPFGTKASVANSPPRGENASKSVADMTEEELANFNPFGTKSAIANSPPRIANSSTFDLQDIGNSVDHVEVKRVSPEQSDSASFGFNVEDSTPDSTSELPSANGNGNYDSAVPHEADPINGLTDNSDMLPTPSGLSENLGHELTGDDDFGAGEEEFFPAEEVFAPADPAAFDVDFLEKAGSTSSFQASALARQSLYVKFDPLVKPEIKSDSPIRSKLPPAVTRLGEVDEEDLFQMDTPPPSKPTSRIPSHNSNSHGTPKEIDRLLQYSPVVQEPGMKFGDSPKVYSPPKEEGIVELLKYSQTEMDTVVRKARHQVQKEMEKRLEEQHQKYQKLEKEKDTLDKAKSDMKALVTEYERTIQQMMGDMNHHKNSSEGKVEELQREKEQALDDLASVENAFSDLHRRYEKLRNTIEGYKKNEDILKKCVSDYQAKLKKQDHRYQTLKSHAEEKIEKANAEIDKVKKSYIAEITGLQAAMKREQMKAASQEKTIEQKTKENTELTNICDELIAKMGGGSGGSS